MKQGKPLITFVMFAILAVLCVYFGVYVYQALNEPYRTTLVYPYTADDSVEADGLLVRQESVFPAQSGIVELTRSEGERVGVGQEVALVYQNTQAQADQAQIQALSQEIELLEYAMSLGGTLTSAARLDEDILQDLVELRASAALGDFGDLEDQVRAVKSDVLRRGYTYEEGVTAGDLTARLQELRGQRSAVVQRSAAATTRVTAGQSGYFSSLVDGYESALTPNTVLQLTPSALQSLLDSPPAQGGSSTGKLILSDRWYFAANLPAEAAQRLSPGETALLRFQGDFTQDVDMTVVQVGEPEGEQCTVVFSSDRYLSRTTLLRRQTAQLIFESWSGLRIPKTARRLVEATVTDEETGQESVETRLGVYALVNKRTEFKEVEVLTEGSDYYVVTPADTGRRALRAGDEVITQATGLEDGQLLIQ